MPTKPKASQKIAASIVLIVIAAAYFTGLLRVDSMGIFGILFLDELIIISLTVAAAILAIKDGRKIRTIFHTRGE